MTANNHTSGIESYRTLGSDTEALQKMIDECAASGGGTVHVPAGEYTITPIELRSHITLHLDAGATLRASTDPNEYGLDGYPLDALIVAKDVSDVSIIGRGTIDGRGEAFVDMDTAVPFDVDELHARQGSAYERSEAVLEEAPVTPKQYRPDNMLLFYRCDNVCIDGVTIRDSPRWTVHLLGCDGVTIDGVRIRNHLRIPNNDGIVPTNSRNVHISNCDVQTGDDGIVLKTMDIEGVEGPCENVMVTNCTITSRSCAIIVGGETVDDITNCTFQNCIVSSSNRGLGVRLLDEGSIRNVVFSNIVVETKLFAGNWWGQAEPIYVLAVPRSRDTDVGTIQNVLFSDIIATSEQGVVVYGSTESVVRDLTFDGVSLTIREGARSTAVGGNFDIRWLTDTSPPSDPDLPTVFMREIPAIFCRHVAGLDVRDVTVTWEEETPDFFSDGLFCEQFEAVEIDGFEGSHAPDAGTNAAITLQDGTDITVRDSRAAMGTKTFLSLAGTRNERLFTGNDVTDAEVPIRAETEAFTQ